MCNRSWIKKLFLFSWVSLFPLASHASFIESTIGTAVVNDATATYYNPAALTLLKNSQIIGLGSVATLNSRFTGQAVQTATGFTLSGSSSNQTRYYLPSLYLAIPTTHKITFGLAIISDSFNSDIEGNSILRYAKSSNSIRAIDIAPAVGFKINDCFSLGVGLDLSHANLILRPISGFPSLNIPDSQSRNDVSSTGVGGDAGLLLKPTNSTMIGFNYHSAVTYRFNGKSILNGISKVISDHYNFTFWTPASSVVTINQFVTPCLGFIGTIRRIQWSIFNNINIRGIATQVGPRAVIVNASVPFRLHNTWLLTLGSHYRITPKWIIRVAGSYNQSPGNPNFQIANGDSIILGASMGYEVNKHITIDGSYAHVFMQNENIHVTAGRNIIHGTNTGSRDGVSLKLTFNI